MKRVMTIFAMLIMLLAGLNLAQSAIAEGEKGGAASSVKSSPGCENECKTCASVCEKTLAYCKKQGGKHVEAAHTDAIKDCISACKLSEEFMGRGSSLMSKSCGLCKEACLKCAETCETFKGDKTMKACADECRKCAKSCDKMAG